MPLESTTAEMNHLVIGELKSELHENATAIGILSEWSNKTLH